jgi:alkylation response protein AidB-like acyl-CoA dehydrogenase
MTDLHVPPEALLGQHLPGTRRGIWGAVKAFDIVRVQVGAMALGTAMAVADYVRERRSTATGSAATALAMIDGRIVATERLLHSAATELDAGRGRGHLSSLAKLEAVELAQLATRRLPSLLGRGALLDHPLLEKWRRDSAGFELMEGTAAIQKLNIAEGQLRAFPGSSP